MPRDYKDEYAKFQASESQKNDRVQRNKNRRGAAKKGRVAKGDGKDIDHIDGNPRNNSPKNLRVVPKSINRAKR
jgi:HNH endonuclease